MSPYQTISSFAPRTLKLLLIAATCAAITALGMPLILPPVSTWTSTLLCTLVFLALCVPTMWWASGVWRVVSVHSTADAAATTSAFWRTWILAICVISLVVGGGALVIEQTAVTARTHSQLIDQIGRQQMLGQRLAVGAATHKVDHSSESARDLAMLGNDFVHQAAVLRSTLAESINLKEQGEIVAAWDDARAAIASMESIARQLAASPDDLVETGGRELFATLLDARSETVERLDLLSKHITAHAVRFSQLILFIAKLSALLAIWSMIVVTLLAVEPAIRRFGLTMAALQQREREAKDLATIAEVCSSGTIITDRQGRIRWANPAFTTITGYSLEEVRGRKPGDFLQGPDTDQATVRHMRAAQAEGKPFIVEIFNYSKTNAAYWTRIEAAPVRAADGQMSHFVSVQTDIDSKRRAELLATGHARVLEMTARRDALPAILTSLCNVIAEQLTGARAVVMLIGDDKLKVCGSMGFTDEHIAMLDGSTILERSGPCDTAAATGERLACRDLTADARWASYQPVALRCNLRGCWVEPMRNSSGAVIGVISTYHAEPRTPTIAQAELMSDLAQLAVLAVERRGAEDELRRTVADLTILRDEQARHTQELATRAGELELLRDKAEQATRSKSEFLANMSHEIRTPLTAIMGFADVLREDGELSIAPKQRLDTIDTIRSASHHLLTLINDILDLSKIEAGRMTVEAVETPLVQIVAEVESLMRPRARSKHLEMTVTLQSPLPDRIIADPTRLRQVLMNLVGNATKFTERGGVTLSLGQLRGEHGPQLFIDVIDTGPGLTPEQAERLFAAFSQADGSITRKHGGTGLGLVICRRLAELMGGSVELAETVPGKGSRFRLTLPLQLAPGAEFVNSIALTRHKGPLTTANATALSGQILLAEDGPDNQRLISYHLRKAGAEVAIAENGVVALAMIDDAESRKKPFDLLLTDMQMPEMDGYTLATTLRRRGSTMPIIALTAHAMAEDREKCLRSGCDDYASKPIDKHRLLATCAQYLQADRTHSAPASPNSHLRGPAPSAPRDAA